MSGPGQGCEGGMGATVLDSWSEWRAQTRDLEKQSVLSAGAVAEACSYRTVKKRRACSAAISAQALAAHRCSPIFVAMSETSTVKKWFGDTGFGFFAPDDGGDDVFIHCKQLVDTEVLEQGDTVSFDKEYDDRKGKYKASNCTMTSGGGGGVAVAVAAWAEAGRERNGASRMVAARAGELERDGRSAWLCLSLKLSARDSVRQHRVISVTKNEKTCLPRCTSGTLDDDLPRLTELVASGPGCRQPDEEG